MAREVFISIIVPVYNVIMYLDECMRSLTNQTLKDLEIICVDDASTDGSRKLLQDYADRDPRIRLICLEGNRSACVARIRGVQASSGRFIMFVDPDDYLAEDACEKLFKYMEKAHCDIFHFVSEVVGAEADSPRGLYLNKLINPKEKRIRGDLVKECFRNERFGYQLWNKIYRGELVRKAMEDCPEEYLPKAQDLLAFFLIAFRAETYQSQVTKPLYYYRMGVGVTGGRFLTRSQLKKNGMQLLIPSKIREFLKTYQAEEQYEQVVCKIENSLLADSVNKLVHSSYQEDKAYGWKMLCEYCSVEKLLQCMGSLFLLREEKMTDICDYIVESFEYPSNLKTIGTYYPRLKNGGVQRVMAHLVQLWTDMGYRVVVITEERQEDEYDLPEGVKRYCLSSFDGLSDEKKTRQYIAERILQFGKIVREERIDLFVTHQWLNVFMLWDLLAVKASGALFCIHCHSVFSVPLIEKTMLHSYKTMPEIYRLSDGVITLSDTDRFYWRQYNPKTYKTINPLPFENLRRSPLELKNQTVLWVGRLSREKRPLDIPEIMERVVSAVPNARMLMIGGGNPEIEEELKSVITEKGLQDNIVMTGFQKDVGKYYREASVYLSTSEYEGFPLSIGEAQIYGLPVVGYDLFYLSILEDRKGCILAPIGRTERLAEGIIKLLSSPEDYYTFSEDALNNIRKFDVDLSELWQQIFDDIMDKKTTEEPDKRWGKLTLDTIRQQVTLHNDWDGLSGSEKSKMALTIAFPTPKAGHGKEFRRKAALFIRVLLIDGLSAVIERTKNKKQQEETD